MTYLASSAGALIVSRNQWQANATDTSTGAHPPGWTNGQPWSETATEWMNDRNTWYSQAQAWYTSRYNDGYAAGDAAGRAAVIPAGSGSSPETFTSSAATNNGTLPFTGTGGSVSGNSSGTLTLVRDGYYIIRVRCSVSSSGSSGAYCELDLRVNGSSARNSRVSDTVGGTTDCGPSWEGVVTGSRTVSVSCSDKAGSLPSTSIFITFVPTPTYPH